MTLEPKGYLPRIAEKNVRLALEAAGAVNIEGPKSCGKTWCSRKFANSEFSLVDPTNNFNNRKIAEIDPSATLKGERPRLIDEWQDVPKIWDAVRYTVDLDGEKGSYILCGSSSVDKGALMHSGAGRIIDVRMRPMSLYESKDSSGVTSLKNMFEGTFAASNGESASLEKLAWLIVRGGWPGNLEKEEPAVRIESIDYIQKACGVDAQRMDGRKRDMSGLLRTFRSLARNESTLATKNRIASDILESESERIDDNTVADYMDVFDRLFLRDDQPAFNPHRRSSARVGKSPKRHFVDPSLAAAALNLGTGDLVSDLKTMGLLFESLCERDLRIYAGTMDGALYHYRDHDGKEIDAVVEVPGKGWGAFEIKLGQGAVDSAAENLLRIKHSMERKEPGAGPLFLCVITGIGSMSYQRDDGVYVVPITNLGP